jgi:hypothetical protein
MKMHNDMVATVKSHETQRAMLAEMAGDRNAATRYFLAAAHLELVLAEDYSAVGAHDLAFRSRWSAASCFWRAGQTHQAQSVFDALGKTYPDQLATIQQILPELTHVYSTQAS